MNSTCYYYEEFHTTHGNLDPSIDCTYVLIMHKSPRKEQIYQNVMKSNLTSHIIFQYNHGYKKCNKNLRKDGPNYDLEHANKTAFSHALNRGYKRIIVLEDDCQFDDRILEREVVDDLNTFLIGKNPKVYNLGPTVSISSPIDILKKHKHHLLLYNNASHAMVYNDEYMHNAINTNFMLGHADFETNRHTSKYTYHKPLAYQIVERSENSKDGWGYLWNFMDIFIIRPTGIDKQVQPGYDILKRNNDYLSLFIFVTLFLLIVKTTFFTK